MNDALETIIAKADGIVDDFVHKWRKSPELWLQEIDIQIELASRIKDVIPEGLQSVTRKHSLFKKRLKGDGVHQFSRVTCEPYVKCGVVGRMHPDIVIWNDSELGQSIEFDTGKTPILWACEIKYDEKNHQDDFAKLKSIQKDGILTAGCALRLHLTKRSGSVAPMPQVEGRVRYLEAWL